MEVLNYHHPSLKDEILDFEAKIHRIWFCSGEMDPSKINLSFRIVATAAGVFTRVCSEQGKTGAILAISKRKEKAAILYVQIGQIGAPDTNYEGGKLTKYVDMARGKVQVLQEHPEFSRSSRNSELTNRMRTIIGGEIIPGGAVAFDDIIIGASGLGSDPIIDENAVLEIGERLFLTEDWKI